MDLSSGTARILVVEPKLRYLGVLARRLGEGGFRVSTACDPQSAIAELYRAPIDLVLADLHLPRGGTAELIGMVRGEAIWRDLPVMLVTGRSEPRGAVVAYEMGADDVILKPFHFDVLCARIHRRIARARSFAALRHDNAALDARVVARAIELGELREQLARREADLHRYRSASSAAG